MNPDFPGKLDLGAWEIGRRYCHEKYPACRTCPLEKHCKKQAITKMEDHEPNYDWHQEFSKC